MRKYFDVVFLTTSIPAVGAYVYVYGSNGALAQLYSDNGVTPIANPVSTDRTGFYSFYVANGTYTIQYVLAGVTLRTLTNVQIFDESYLSTAPVTPEQFGAVGNGVTDDYPAFAAALASGAPVVQIGAKTYRLSQGITVPTSCQLVGQFGVIAGSNGPSSSALLGGTVLQFDVGVMTCVTCGGPSAANGTANLRGLTVARATGSIPSGSIGVLVQNLQMPSLQDIYSIGHDVPLYFKSNGTSGISAWLTRCFTATAQDAHVVIDGYPEWRANQCRFGNNGGIDIASNAYIRIKGGSTSSGSGPNTIVLSNCHFNQANGTVAGAVLAFQSLGTTGGVCSTVKMTDCYAEDYTVAITTDSTVLSLRRLSLKGCTFNATSGLTPPTIFALNAATVVNEWELVGNEFFGSGLTLGPTTFNGLSVVGNRFGCPVSVTCSTSSNSTATFMGNTYLNGGLTVGGNGWISLSVTGEAPQSGNPISVTATPAQNVNLAVPQNSVQSWTPALSLGGANTGITYSTQSGGYQLFGNMVIAQFRIILTSKGTATGNATITGLPFGQNPNSFQSGGGGALTTYSGMSALAGSVMLQAVSGAAHNITLFTFGAGGVGNVTDANFTATSSIAGFVIFFV